MQQCQCYVTLCWKIPYLNQIEDLSACALSDADFACTNLNANIKEMFQKRETPQSKQINQDRKLHSDRIHTTRLSDPTRGCKL